jgi:hypothetical protein
MALSMPEIANAAATGYSTRTKGSEGPLNSSPEPLLFKNIQRTLELSDKLYKDGWKSYSLDQLKTDKKLLVPQHPNESAHVLAIAVEKLDGSTAQQTDIKRSRTCSIRSSPATRWPKRTRPAPSSTRAPLGPETSTTTRKPST